MKPIIVIGAGVAGLAVSIRLRCLGFAVTVIEANAQPGGKLSEHWQNGCRFDRGPSLLTLPHYIDELFHLAGRLPQDYFRYIKLDSACKYFYPDGTIINGYSNPQQFADEIEKKLGVNSAVIKNYLQDSEYIYNLSAPTFLNRSLHDWRTYINAQTFNTFIHSRSMHLFNSFSDHNQKQLKHPKLVQLFNRFATYNGSDPYQAPATLAVIPHLEHGMGTYIAEKGMFSVTKSLFQLAQDLGVNFHFNEPVQEILLDKKRVCGVRTANRKLQTKTIISNIDAHLTYKVLLRKQKHTINREKLSTSAIIFYFNIKKTFTELDVHNIFFSENDREEFKQLWGQRKIYLQDPTIYLYISSKKINADAAEGYENWFVMINTPPDQGEDWSVLRKQLRAQVIAKLSRILGQDINALITDESYLDPHGIAQTTGAYAGALYGYHSNTIWSAFLRQANRDRTYKGLYFCGGSVHPGGGIPLCLQSAKITVDLWMRDQNNA